MEQLCPTTSVLWLCSLLQSWLTTCPIQTKCLGMGSSGFSNSLSASVAQLSSKICLTNSTSSIDTSRLNPTIGGLWQELMCLASIVAAIPSLLSAPGDNDEDLSSGRLCWSLPNGRSHLSLLELWQVALCCDIHSTNNVHYRKMSFVVLCQK